MTAVYVLFNLENNSYLLGNPEYEYGFSLTKDYRDAFSVDTKEKLIHLLDLYGHNFSQLGHHWTTREYFII